MLETSLQCGSNSSKQSKSEHKLTVRSVPNLALRKKWYYINLKGKTQGKGEKQGPSVENKPFLWVRIEKICPEKKSVRRGHFFENVSILDTFLDTFFKLHNNITQRSETHTNNVWYVFCRKLTLVVVQNTWNTFRQKSVHGGHFFKKVSAVDTFFENVSTVDTFFKNHK